MIEEILRLLAFDRFEAESAGLEPGELNPLVVEALKEYKVGYCWEEDARRCRPS